MGVVVQQLLEDGSGRFEDIVWTDVCTLQWEPSDASASLVEGNLPRTTQGVATIGVLQISMINTCTVVIMEYEIALKCVFAFRVLIACDPES